MQFDPKKDSHLGKTPAKPHLSVSSNKFSPFSSPQFVYPQQQTESTEQLPPGLLQPLRKAGEGHERAALIEDDNRTVGSIGRSSKGQKFTEKFGGNQQVNNNEFLPSYSFSSDFNPPQAGVRDSYSGFVDRMKSSKLRGDKLAKEEFQKDPNFPLPTDDYPPGLMSFDDSRSTDANSKHSFDSSQSSFLDQTKFKNKKDLSSFFGEIIQEESFDRSGENRETNSKRDAELVLELITKNKINCVPLLNEVGSKTKKEVDCVIKEVTVNKNKQFQCTYTLGGEILGFGKGLSKQDAKSKAAENSVKTLLTEDIYPQEKSIIVLSVGKKADDTAPLDSANTSSILSSLALDKAKEASLDNAIYELNLICKVNNIEAQWEVNLIPNSNPDEYEAIVKVEELSASGIGRKKIEAKREAALQIVQKINSDPELKKRYDRSNKPQKKKDGSNSRQEKDRLFSTRSIQSKQLEAWKKKSSDWGENFRKSLDSLEESLANVNQKLALSDKTNDMLEKFFNEVATYTEMVNSSKRFISVDFSDHLSNYVASWNFIPIGSFALNCSHPESRVIDVAFVYQEEKKTSEIEILTCYKNCLVKLQDRILSETPDATFKMSFEIKNNDGKNSLLVSTETVVGKLQLNIITSDSVTKSAKISIHHVKRIYDCFEKNEKLEPLRGLMRLFRFWRRKNSLEFFPPELFDIAILSEYLTNKSTCLGLDFVRCLNILSSEDIFKAMLERFGPQYTGLYKEIPLKLKYKVMTISLKTFENIFRGEISKIFFP